MFAKAFSLLFLASTAVPAALAKIFITQPVASTVWPVGQSVTVTWQDDGSAPNLAAIGVCDLGIYAGNQLQQTLLQAVGTLDVSQQNSISFQIDGDIGPNNVADYFMRFTSKGLMDPANPQFPEQAFSAMFSITGSTSTGFNASVQAEIDGQSTAGAIGAGAASTPAATAGAARTSTIVVTVSNTKAAASTSKPSASAQAGAAHSGDAACARLSTPALIVAAAAFAAFFL